LRFRLPDGLASSEWAGAHGVADEAARASPLPLVVTFFFGSRAECVRTARGRGCGSAGSSSSCHAVRNQVEGIRFLVDCQVEKKKKKERKKKLTLLADSLKISAAAKNNERPATWWEVFQSS